MAADTEQVASHDSRVQPANRLFFLQRSYSFGLLSILLFEIGRKPD